MQGRRNEEAGGSRDPLGRSITLFQPGGRLCPLHYYWPPLQIFGQFGVSDAGYNIASRVSLRHGYKPYNLSHIIVGKFSIEMHLYFDSPGSYDAPRRVSLKFSLELVSKEKLLGE